MLRHGQVPQGSHVLKGEGSPEAVDSSFLFCSDFFMMLIDLSFRVKKKKCSMKFFVCSKMKFAESLRALAKRVIDEAEAIEGLDTLIDRFGY